MHLRILISLTAAAALLAASGAAAQTADTSAAAEPFVLRVCADPDNMPFSNERQEGFENKLAEVLARDLGGTVKYTWWPQRRGFMRNTLRAKECDVLMDVPGGFDPVSATRPYYRSTYYVVTRAERNLRITSLDDPALKGLKVGVNLIGEDYSNTPPAHALGARGIMAVGFDSFYDETRRPGDIVRAVERGDIDAAVVWGPLAGYFVKQSKVPLSLVPLADSVDRTGLPFAFDMALGVRRSDKLLRARLDSALERRRADVERILREYNVPTLSRPTSR